MEGGRRLDDIGTARFSWWDFKVWVNHRPPTSVFYQAVHGPYYPLSLRIEGLMADLLMIANWQRGRTGPKPKTNRWPWSKRDQVEQFGKAAPIDDVRDFLTWRNGRAPATRR